MGGCTIDFAHAKGNLTMERYKKRLQGERERKGLQLDPCR